MEPLGLPEEKPMPLEDQLHLEALGRNIRQAHPDDLREITLSLASQVIRMRRWLTDYLKRRGYHG
jgi:hypothetical protein